MSAERKYNYIFTWNNYNDDVEKVLGNFYEAHCVYLTYGREIAPETGTPHLQGYFELKSAKTITAIQKNIKKLDFNIGFSYLAVRLGSQQDAIDYSQKDGDVVELGTPKSQGSRTDLTEIRTILTEDPQQGLRRVSEEYFGSFIRYHRGFTLYQNMQLRPRDLNVPPEVYWYWGLSGTGKTRSAFELQDNDSAQIYVKDNSKWWDGYIQQPLVVIDDFDVNEFGFRQFLQVIDRYPKNVEVKGGSIPLNSPIIVITCEHHPDDIYHDNENKIAQIVRRLTKILEFKK